jgi:acyl-CoA thioesterase-2
MFTSLLYFDRCGENRFKAPPSPESSQPIFGGELLAQSLYAALQSTDEERDVNSLHAYFLRPGDINVPVEFNVEYIRDGRSFSSRQVIAMQQGKELFRTLVSIQTPAETPHYARGAMPDVPPPEYIPFTYDDFNSQQSGENKRDGSRRPIDIRYINPPSARGESVTESQLMWMRIEGTLPDEPRIHRAGLAYLCDSTLIDHVMLPHGLHWQDADFQGASLDHAMWFHRPARADQWLLFEQSVEATGGGRGLVSGRYFDRDGHLVANCIQEGLMRWATP